MLKMQRNTGSEGPTHDLYAWQEFRLETEGMILTLHVGLVTWFKAVDKDDGTELLCRGDRAAEEWTTATGITPEQFERAYAQVHGPKEKCPKCGTQCEISGGMVGETILYCPSDKGGCGDYMWSEEVTDSMIM